MRAARECPIPGLGPCCTFCLFDFLGGAAGGEWRGGGQGCVGAVTAVLAARGHACLLGRG